MKMVATFVCFLLGISSIAIGQSNAPHPPDLPGSPGAIFVPLPICRILSTLHEPAQNGASQGARQVDLRSTRCGRIVPSYAIGFALRTVAYNRNVPDHASSAAGRTERQITLPAQANGALNFNITPNEDLAVDVYGYFVAGGTPVSPTAQTVPGGGSFTTAATGEVRAQATGRPVAQSVHTGDLGDIYLDASVAPFNATGVLMRATANYPWLVAKTATADAGSGFGVYNSANNAVMMTRSDGAVQLLNGAFLDGRSDYFGAPGAYYGFVAVPTNIVHDVTLIDPRDSAGGATNRVVFFNAQTDGEYQGPNITKFRAFTDGWDNHQHINFDSQIDFHSSGNQLYHFRAYSALEGKDTFWVRPETNGTYNSNTRADMYVSGKVGIGTTTPATQLDVTDAIYAGPRLTGSGQQVSVLRGGYNSGYYSEVASYIPAGAPGVDSIGWKIRPYYYGSATGGRFDAVTITPAGKVGIGIEPTALLQLAPPAGTWGYSQSANGTFYVDAPGVTGGRFAILEDGRVGIGTNTPALGMRLDVAGAAHFSGNVDVGGVIYAKYQDVAEWVPSEGDLPSGTVVVLNRLKSNAVAPSAKAYDTAVAGVVSDAPGVLLGVAGANKAKIATTGRVKVRVDARTHPVAIGDLLVTSDVPGTAMLSEPMNINGRKFHQPGTLIGKALEPLASGEGEILVLLTLQ